MNRPSDPSPAPLNSHELPPPTADGVDMAHPEVGNPDINVNINLIADINIDIANPKVRRPPKKKNIPTSASTKEAFKRLYIILIVIGLSIGVVAAIGVVNLLNRWGLTQPPPPIEQPIEQPNR